MSSSTRRKTRRDDPANKLTSNAPAETVNATETTSKSVKRKRKVQDPLEELDIDEFVDHLLSNPKSKLTSIEFNELINEDTWYSLPAETRAILCSLLPKGTFRDHETTVDWSHPAGSHHETPQLYANEQLGFADAMDSEQPDVIPPPFSEDELCTGPPPAFMIDPSFRSACITFQDHLFTGWYKTEMSKKLISFKENVIDGTSHVPWKDEAWEEDESAPTSSFNDLNLFDIFKENQKLIREGDILSFTAHFHDRSSSKLIATTADLLLYSIDATKHSGYFTFLLPPLPSDSPHSTLPAALVLPPSTPGSVVPSDIPETNPPIQETTVSKISDLEGLVVRRISKSLNYEFVPSNVGLKNWTVHRWSENFERDILPIFQGASDDLALDEYAENLGTRGGRSRIATLYYLAHLAVS